jgi:hypothetical protein|tara:strand:+ start:1651 stop:2088 length:438 start_codon:yes stop_codon:yes gene_type:complete
MFSGNHPMLWLEVNMQQLIIFLALLFGPMAHAAEVWLCEHPSQDREALTFMVGSADVVDWTHARLGEMDPLKLIANSDMQLTMATQRVNIMYSRFFHLDKYSGRMGETTFRGSILRRLAEKDPSLNWDMVTTLWMCEKKDQISQK